MSKTAMIRARIEPDIKEQAENVLKNKKLGRASFCMQAIATSDSQLKVYGIENTRSNKEKKDSLGSLAAQIIPQFS